MSAMPLLFSRATLSHLLPTLTHALSPSPSLPILPLPARSSRVGIHEGRDTLLTDLLESTGLTSWLKVVAPAAATKV